MIPGPSPGVAESVALGWRPGILVFNRYDVILTIGFMGSSHRWRLWLRPHQLMTLLGIGNREHLPKETLETVLLFSLGDTRCPKTIENWLYGFSCVFP